MGVAGAQSAATQSRDPADVAAPTPCGETLPGEASPAAELFPKVSILPAYLRTITRPVRSAEVAGAAHGFARRNPGSQPSPRMRWRRLRVW